MSLIPNFDNGFDAFVVDGRPRKLALTAPKPKAMLRFRDVLPTLPESQWRPTDRLGAIGDLCPRYDQGEVGECEPTSEVEAVGQLRAISGLAKVKLSASFLYAMINGGSDDGASIGDGFPVLQQFGVCRDELCPTGKFFVRGQLSRAMFDDARNYRALVAYHCPSFEEIVAAHLAGFAVVHGVTVVGTFGDLDRDGCYPPARGYPNHAVSMWDLRRRANGEWYLWDNNHWGLDWGVDGCFGTSRTAYEAEGFQDALAYQVVSVDAGTTLPPRSSVT